MTERDRSDETAHRPPVEPGPAEPRAESEPGPVAPDGEAPSMDRIQPGEGEGESPGE